jgi:hypothetical protein
MRTKKHISTNQKMQLILNQIPVDCEKKIISQSFKLPPISDRTNAERKNRICHALLKFAKKIFKKSKPM